MSPFLKSAAGLVMAIALGVAAAAWAELSR